MKVDNKQIPQPAAMKVEDNKPFLQATTKLKTPAAKNDINHPTPVKVEIPQPAPMKVDDNNPLQTITTVRTPTASKNTTDQPPPPAVKVEKKKDALSVKGVKTGISALTPDLKPDVQVVPPPPKPARVIDDLTNDVKVEKAAKDRRDQYKAKGKRGGARKAKQVIAVSSDGTNFVNISTSIGRARKISIKGNLTTPSGKPISNSQLLKAGRKAGSKIDAMLNGERVEVRVISKEDSDKLATQVSQGASKLIGDMEHTVQYFNSPALAKLPWSEKKKKALKKQFYKDMQYTELEKNKPFDFTEGGTKNVLAVRKDRAAMQDRTKQRRLNDGSKQPKKPPMYYDDTSDTTGKAFRKLPGGDKASKEANAENKKKLTQFIGTKRKQDVMKILNKKTHTIEVREKKKKQTKKNKRR